MKFLFSGWDDATNAQRAAIVFENRNKLYGAYMIRTCYGKNLGRALVISASLFLLLAASSNFAAWITAKAGPEIKSRKDVVVNLTEPPSVDEVPPPPPPSPPQNKVRETVKFIPPKVVDAPVEEAPPPAQEKLSRTTLSTVTQEGERQIDIPAEQVIDPDEEKIFTIVDEMPAFPGGTEKLFAFLRSNLKYPPAARENNVQGRVAVNFIVDRNGKISEAKILKGIGSGCDEEALRVVLLMPDWTPGRHNGKPVIVRYYLPVEFRLN